MNVFEQLAARCEAAAGPDRELDLVIDCEVRPDEWSANVRETHNPGYPVHYFNDEELPRYTGSRDAAATLAPGGLLVLIDQQERSWAVGLWSNIITPIAKAEAATEALARTAAALRARAAL